MNKKKILYIHHGKGIGGAPLSLLYLIENLNKEKYHPIVLFLHDSEVIQLYKSKGIEVVGPVNLFDFPHTKIFWYRWYHAHRLLRSFLDTFKTGYYFADYCLDNIKPDLVHLNTSSLIAWAKVASSKNIPVIFHVREPLADGYLGLRKFIVKKMVAKYSNYILPICKNDSKPWIGNNKVNIVYNAVDHKNFDKDLSGDDFLSSYNLSKNIPKILFLGGLSQEKGTLFIFEIFKRLLKIEQNVQLLVAGYFDQAFKSFLDLGHYTPSEFYKTNVLRVLKKVDQNVIFLGSIKNVPLAMAASDIIVFPATVGHFARPVIEAGFMCKPVVASNLPPLDELVLDGKTGYLVNLGDYEKWVEKLHTLLINKKLNHQLGKNAYQYCLQNFDIDMQIEKIENIYDKVSCF